jgi:hypothetical protein
MMIVAQMLIEVVLPSKSVGSFPLLAVGAGVLYWFRLMLKLMTSQDIDSGKCRLTLIALISCMAGKPSMAAKLIMGAMLLPAFETTESAFRCQYDILAR